MLLKNLSISEGLVNGSRGVVESFIKDPESSKEIPIIRFAVGDGEVSRAIGQKEFTIELGDKIVASRIQLPLKLAWGISIHKSQGMTIDLLDVDLFGVFETGMTYVALSRGVSMDRIKVRNFSIKGVRTNPKVISFYNSAGKENDNNQQPIHKPRAVTEPTASSENEDPLNVQKMDLPMSKVLKKPFKSPLNDKAQQKREALDMEGWRAMYTTEFKKPVVVKPRNRFHTELLREAEEAVDTEKPHLPIEFVENALVFKRTMSRRQLIGNSM